MNTYSRRWTLTDFHGDVNLSKYSKFEADPHNKMPSLIPIGVLVEYDVKFHDNTMDFFYKNTIEMNQNV